MEPNYHFELIKSNSELFHQLRYSENAIPTYELLSDGLKWSDEVPDDRSRGAIDILRFLWRFRIVQLQLLSGQKTTEKHLDVMKADWKFMLLECPNWPGFRSDRCNNLTILKIYEEQKKDFNKRFPLPDW